jgi:hypothetical protein
MPKGHLPALPKMSALAGYAAAFVSMFVCVFATYWAFDDDPMIRVCQVPA